MTTTPTPTQVLLDAEVDPDDLYKAAAAANRVAASGAQVVELTPSGADTLLVGAADDQHTITVAVAGKVAGVGSVVLPARRLLATVGELRRSGTVRVAANPDEVTLRRGSLAATIPRASVELPWLQGDRGPEATATVRAADFAGCLAQVAPFRSEVNDPASATSGLRLQLVEGRLRATAVDASRMATRSLPAPSLLPDADGQTAAECVLPGPAVERIAGLAAGSPSDSRIEVRFGVKTVRAAGDVWTLTTRLLDAPWPRTEEVLGFVEGHPSRVRLRRMPLRLAAAVAVQTLTGQLTVPAHLTFGSASVAIEMETEAGAVSETVDLELLAGEPAGRMGFSPRLLATALDTVGSAAVELRLGEPNEPVLLTPHREVGDDDDLQVVIAPMTL